MFMIWMIRFYLHYLKPALLGLLGYTILLLLISMFISEQKVFWTFLCLASLPFLHYLNLFNTASFGMVGLIERLLKALPKRLPMEEKSLTLKDELAEIAAENVAHAFAALCVIGSIYLVHMVLELALGHDAKLFDRIPIRYIFDLAHLVVLAKLIFTLLFLQRVKASWAGRNTSTPDLVDALKDENAKVRRKAAKLLGEWTHVDSDKPATALVDALSDEDKLVRRYAAAALNQVKERMAKKDVTTLKKSMTPNGRRQKKSTAR